MNNPLPIIKVDDEIDAERSYGPNIPGTDIKNIKNLNKIDEKGKNNLLKIVNMYMKDDKKIISKMKINSYLKSLQRKKKKSIF